MPELPEVETITKGLREAIKGQKIIKIEILEPKSVVFLGQTFIKKVKGQKIEDIKRRAKLLMFTLGGNVFMLVHLKITGQLIIHDEKDALDKFTRVVFYLSNRKKLYFNDLRKFGYLKLFNKESLETELKRLNFGPEPLEKEFTLPVFENILIRRKKMAIKPLLMEQSLIAGIGNIYAAEACFVAGIRPTRRAGTLKKEEIKKLHEAVIKVLKESLKYGGTSADSYVDAYGKEGTFEKRLKVYGRKNQNCYRCSGRVIRIAQAGRGTFYCPKCQK